MKRCAWASDSAEMLVYHDKEWGVPKKKVSELFECLTLEIFQAGLSWSTVLRKREAFRDDFSTLMLKKLASLMMKILKD
ncbi:DNA-3-methyladenine glycosylase I [Apilactobacillus kunkeei]|uniref:DNA-3-methyladenine glycosylase I n=1 Tax=Apilactobacillus kunkeei TaxID=148814 RepID=A0A0N1IZU8_9LACO|nr:DNA-3-methyladenine glycosylase I [Apilactobacillus kunkeei]